MSCVDDRTLYGLGLIERGVRDYDAWAKQMRDDLGEHTDYELSYIYNNARIEYAKELSKNSNIVRPASVTTIDQIVNALGRDGAARFMESIEDAPGESRIFDAMAHGTLEGDDLDRASRAWAEAQQERAKPTTKPKIQAIRDIQDKIRDDRLSKNVPAANPVSQVLSIVSKKSGVEAARKLRRALSENGRDTILEKIGRGQPLTDVERAKATKAFSDAAEFHVPAPALVDAAKEQVRQTNANARNAAREELADARTTADWVREWGYKNLDPEHVNGFIDRVDRLGANPTPHQLASEIRKAQPTTAQDRVVALYRAGLLTGARTLGKVIGGHLSINLLDEMKRIPASLVDMAVSKSLGVDRMAGGASVTALRNAVTKGVPQGLRAGLYMVRNGPLALTIKRLQDSDTSLLAAMGHSGGVEGLRSEPWFNNPVLRAYATGPMRVHGSIYEVVKAFGIQQAVHDQANVAAMNETAAMRAAGETVPDDYVKSQTAHYIDHPSATMAEQAISEVETMTLTNDNALTKWHGMGQAALKDHPTAKAVLNIAVPFLRIPSNAVLRTLEYGAGSLHAVGIAGKALSDASKLTKSDVDMGWKQAMRELFTPEMRKNFANAIGRNAVGSTVIAGGFALAAKGFVTPGFNVQPGDHSGSMKIGNTWIPIQNIGPVGTLLVLGADIHHEHQSGNTLANANYVGMTRDTIEDLPYVQQMLQFGSMLDPSKGGANARKAVNAEAASVVPVGLKEIAQATDPRKVQENDPLQAIEASIPVVRGRLPTDTTNAGYEALDKLRGQLNSGTPPAKINDAVMKLWRDSIITRGQAEGFERNPNELDYDRALGGMNFQQAIGAWNSLSKARQDQERPAFFGHIRSMYPNRLPVNGADWARRAGILR